MSAPQRRRAASFLGDPNGASVVPLVCGSVGQRLDHRGVRRWIGNASINQLPAVSAARGVHCAATVFGILWWKTRTP